MLSTVVRAGAVLDLFDRYTPQWGVTEVARRLQLSKSQAHEMLSSLREIGLLRRVDNGRYTLGWRSLALGAIVLQNDPLTRSATRQMRRLVLEHPEVSVSLACWDTGRPVYVSGVTGRGVSVAQAAADPAMSEVSLHSTSVGKMLAAMRDQTCLSSTMSTHDWKRFTPRTITHPPMFASELLPTRLRGFAIEVGEFASDLAGVAAPVHGLRDGTVAVIGLRTTITAWRARESTYVAGVSAAAKAVSRAVQKAAHHQVQTKTDIKRSNNDNGIQACRTSRQT